MAKILVTGASGLLGTEICRQLMAEGHEVWAVDNHSRSSIIPPCSKWLKVDLLDAESYRQLPTDFEYIYHYAAINGTKNFYERPLQVISNNFISDVKMFEFAAGCKNLLKIVYASSSEIVSDDPESPVPENTDITIRNIHNSRWSYRLAKVCSENYLTNSELPYVICRYFNIYGEDSKAGHFIADQMEKIGRGVFEVTGANETRSFCYVEDGIRATIYCGFNVHRDVVNIGNDVETPIVEAAETIARAMGIAEPKFTLLEGKPGSTQTRRPNISKLRSIMQDYRPRTFAEGMAKIVAAKAQK